MGFKIIYPEKQSAVTADSEDSNYLAENLLDSKIKKVWKATSGDNTAKLTVTISAGADAIALYGTNAETAVCVIKDSGGGTVETETHTLTTATRTYKQFWQEFTAQGAEHTAEISLTAASGETVEAGVVKAGTMVALAFNPKYGLQESKRDFSIKKELSNGAWYTRKRDIVRTFSCQVIVTRSTEFYDLSDIYDHYGPDAFACLLADGINDLQWTVFGRMDNPFSGSHDYLSNSNVTISITEAV